MGLVALLFLWFLLAPVMDGTIHNWWCRKDTLPMLKLSISSAEDVIFPGQFSLNSH